ncbi:uncharacterized protein IL334_003501 [Kwoniella shivajii]|uniref:MRPL25 domain-containing protein n=1 Tax=Kwoniella shivajii TaxID=564305 RepID=A0ABZ1CYX4_9TREE|nr:hypothetical protein IL334_003501 [Kwoniella shivajii]
MPIPANSPLPNAFRLVRQILSTSTASEGLTTKELVREALTLCQSENPSPSPSPSPSQGDSSSTSSVISQSPIEPSLASLKGKGKNVVVGKKEKGVNVLPDGHPFISTSFLKSRILAVLQSQDLLLKSPRKSSSSSSSSTPSTPSGSGSSSSGGSSSSNSSSGKPTFVWKISSPRQSNLSTSQWDFPNHWDRLIQGVSPGQLSAEYTSNKIARQKEERERGLDSGKLRRTEKEIWDWQGRKDGITTTLERLHLNKRRAEARPKKERNRIERYESLFGGVKDEARERLGQAA